ncbi:triosephosphate isomerase [Porphyromonas somerae]|nr:triosephosphate isomerase [Porphyromonas somerae]
MIMRKNIVAGNWKMNTSLPEGIQLAKDVRSSIEGKNLNCEVILGVPFTHLSEVAKAVAGSPIKVAAENCASESKGAFTGEVSAEMVASTGATYVILGHSERRQYYHETSAILKKKVELALANQLKPIFCIGEVLEEREVGKHFEVVERQVKEALFDLSESDFKNIVLAYEPVWAIGTGKTATSDQAQEIHAHIRKVIADKYGKSIADNTTILYGGSANGGNAKELFSKPDVDGGLIGGASLSAEKFLPVIEGF